MNFLSECENYLRSWVYVKTGEYVPYNTTKLHNTLMLLVANGSKNPIRDFKKGFEDGTILMSIFCIGLSDEYKKKQYKAHRKIVEEFEKKYNLT